MIDRAELEALVRKAVEEALRADSPPAKVAPAEEACVDGCKPRVVPMPPVRDPLALKKLIEQTPARVAQGRTGTRYLTRTYVGIRAEHAIARDAVESEVPGGFAEKLGCLALATRCPDKATYLLQPDLGRRLSDASRALLEKEGTRGADVQIILADGLSSWAIVRQAEALLPALTQALKALGYSVGRPLFVTFARIGVQDEVGVLTQARATVIAVGERPGLGTGDSLSLYTAVGPRLNQDNAEKNCISNIRPLGMSTGEAASACAELLRRSFAAGGGGLKLVRT